MTTHALVIGEGKVHQLVSIAKIILVGSGRKASPFHAVFWRNGCEFTGHNLPLFRGGMVSHVNCDAHLQFCFAGSAGQSSRCVLLDLIVA